WIILCTYNNLYFVLLTTTLPPAKQSHTWIRSLTLGDYKYINFREIDFWRRYITLLYFVVVTMATVSYGDIHAVNTREMIFIMIFISFDMILGAYLIGNMTALIVKGSNTKRFRDKMTDVIKYTNQNKLDKDIRLQIKSHLRFKYESSYCNASILEDIPVSVRAKISQALYIETVQKVPLSKGCSNDFLSQMVMKLSEEFFLPGEVILEQGSVVDQVYVISHGRLEEVAIGEEGSEESIAELEPHFVFGEVAVLCSIPQPYTVRVSELCRLLRVEKQAFTGILKLYCTDNHQILNNILKGKDTDLRIKQMESDITYLIAKQDSELALGVNSAAYHGDLCHLKGLINAGADPSKIDYDGITALHLAEVLKILYHIFPLNVLSFIRNSDKFGNSPLLEAIQAGHDRVAALLLHNGAKLNLDDSGSYLCKVVVDNTNDFLRRLLENGVNPNSKNYDQRTPLHVATSEGLHIVAKILIQFGPDVFSEDMYL
ncbi:hypothetical protein MKX01_009955, partial [Papaver californicum]